MKIVSWNVNGLRSVFNKGVFLDWINKEKPDIVCLQEIKAWESQLPQQLQELNGYHSYFCEAKKKGYSGVSVYTKEKPVKVVKKLGNKRFDNEGRLLWLQYKKFDLLNVYIPHGGRQKENYNYKLYVYEKFFKKLKNRRRKNIVLAGDFNVAHEEIDLARPKQNKNNIMFTPQERLQIETLISLGYTDSFRLNNEKEGNYTWWPYMANARQRNLGWRIDYIFTSKHLSKKIKSGFIQKQVLGSDHCPVAIELKM